MQCWLAWDLEAERFNANLKELNQFFLDTIHGDLLNQDKPERQGRRSPSAVQRGDSRSG